MSLIPYSHQYIVNQRKGYLGSAPASNNIVIIASASSSAPSWILNLAAECNGVSPSIRLRGSTSTPSWSGRTSRHSSEPRREATCNAVFPNGSRDVLMNSPMLLADFFFEDVLTRPNDSWRRARLCCRRDGKRSSSKNVRLR